MHEGAPAGKRPCRRAPVRAVWTGVVTAAFLTPLVSIAVHPSEAAVLAIAAGLFVAGFLASWSESEGRD